VSDTIITDSTVIDVLSTLREKNPDFIFNTETYYIPESWYIQIMIEGGVLGAILFAVILLSILAKLQKNKYILGATLGIYIMNLFLHSFESVHTAFIWSIVIAGSMMILQNNSEKEKSLRENIL
jgi:hypothetical protein